MYFDGSLMKKSVGVGLVFLLPLGIRMRYMVRLHFPSSNNAAKYEALRNGLCNAIELGIRRLDIRGDSQLVIDQVMKESSYHDTKMAAYCQEVRWLENKFDSLELNHIPRHLNEATDVLAKAASSREPVPTAIFASDQHKPSVLSSPEVMELEEDPMIEPDPLVDWRMLYFDNLFCDALPTDKTEARRLARRAKSFVLVEGELYK
ncbi:uncharacterized protein [Miscanthus floridulus]|uniref:uncharacterized protein n=1 Tax=Miscanthus floridulus TaxID=154761 RepID=UPI00345782A1